MKLIFIAGSWGSGTTSVIGALHHLGVPTLGPFFESNDERTQNTFELSAFRDLVLQYVDESTLQFKDNYAADFPPALARFKAELEDRLPPPPPGQDEQLIALKLPLATLCLPELCQAFDTRVILVHRALEKIEASRLRRGWGPVMGAKGAEHIYLYFLNQAFKHGISFLGIAYEDFLARPRSTIEDMIDYCELDAMNAGLDAAEAYVRR